MHSGRGHPWFFGSEAIRTGASAIAARGASDEEGARSKGNGGSRMANMIDDEDLCSDTMKLETFGTNTHPKYGNAAPTLDYQRARPRMRYLRTQRWSSALHDAVVNSTDCASAGLPPRNASWSRSNHTTNRRRKSPPTRGLDSYRSTWNHPRSACLLYTSKFLQQSMLPLFLRHCAAGPTELDPNKKV